MNKDSLQTVSRSALRFFSGTMLSRITGMLRDIALAFAFGTQGSIAAFMLAFRFAHLFRRLLGEGAMQTAFVPCFEELRKENPARALGFFRNVTASVALVLVCLIVVSMLFCGAAIPYVSSGNQNVLLLTLLMLPSLLFICLFGINGALLQCYQSYFTPSAAPIVFNLIWIAGILSLQALPVDQAMTWLAVCVVIACAGQWAMTIPKTLAILKEGTSQPLQPFSKDVLRLIAPLGLGILGVAAAQINNAMDGIFARYADEEGPAYLWYAIRLQQLPLALFGIALANALLPPLSRSVKNQDWVRFREFLHFATRRTVAFMLPATVGIFLVGDAAVNLIFGHGGFTDTSTVGTTLCLWGYGVGLLPMALVLVFAPAYYAQNDYRTPAIASVASMGANMCFNTILVCVLGWGAASVALSTSVSAWINVGMLAYPLWRQHGFGSWRPALEVVGLCCVAAIVTILLKEEAPAYPKQLISQVGPVAWPSLVFSCTYLGLGRMFGVEDSRFRFRMPY